MSKTATELASHDAALDRAERILDAAAAGGAAKDQSGARADVNAKAEGKKFSYRMDPRDIPQNIRDVVADNLGKHVDVYPARDGGSYRGPVLHADKDFIVQTIGKENKVAVVHGRNDIELLGAALNSRAANNDLPGRNIQVHYKENERIALPWDAARDAQRRSSAAGDRVSASEKVVNTAEKYAEANISSPKQREAFLKHINAVAKEAFPSRSDKDADKGGAETDKPSKAKPAARTTPQRAARQDRQPESALER